MTYSNSSFNEKWSDLEDCLKAVLNAPEYSCLSGDEKAAALLLALEGKYSED